MADLSVQETEMMGKFYGDMNLVNNESFWNNVLVLYTNKLVPLPLVDNPASRRRLSDLLDCPPGKCSECCHYERVPLTDMDIKRLPDLIAHFKKNETDGKENYPFYIDCKNGCPFIKDSSCSVYKNRPDICQQFPMQNPREASIKGKPFLQVTYRVKCLPSIQVIRQIMREATEGGKAILLPDLSVVPTYREESVIPNEKT
jgi:Fe-S-cluster containining protein